MQCVQRVARKMKSPPDMVEVGQRKNREKFRLAKRKPNEISAVRACLTHCPNASLVLCLLAVNLVTTCASLTWLGTIAILATVTRPVQREGR